MRLERIVAVDDRETEIVAALEALLASGVDLVFTSGGLGPTHDDRTVAVRRAGGGRRDGAGRADPGADRRDRGASSRVRAGVDPSGFERGNRKQATVPAGAEVLAPVGTAPGVIVPVGDQRIVVAARAAGRAVAHVARPPWPARSCAPLLAGGLPRKVLRLYGVPESTIADAFEDLGGDAGGTETTICASRAEIEVVIRHPDAAADAAEHLAAGFRERFGRAVFSRGPGHAGGDRARRAARAAGARWRRPRAAPPGLVAARLAGVPGASDVLLGGIVAYANEVKQALLGVPADLLAAHGSVSPEVAQAMAEGARRATGADVAVSVTGVAGPGGGTRGEAGRPGLPARVGGRASTGRWNGASRGRARTCATGRPRPRCIWCASSLQQVLSPATESGVTRYERLSGVVPILTSRPLLRPATTPNRNRTSPSLRGGGHKWINGPRRSTQP